MPIILLASRLILVAVLGLAGVAKAADPGGTREALKDFGFPSVLARHLAWFLPSVEILTAVALLPLSTAWYGSLGALCLLLGFEVAIAVNLLRGRSPDCHCFGQLHSAPVSWWLFGRNLGLLAAAALIVGAGRDNPGLSAVGWVGELSAGELATLVLNLIILGLLIPTFFYVRRLLTQQTKLLERVVAMDADSTLTPLEREEAAPPREGLPIGAPAPEFTLTSLVGGQVSLSDLLAQGKPALLLFVSPTCIPCKSLLPMVDIWEREFGHSLTLAIVSKGTLEENRAKMSRYGATYILLQGESGLSDELRARWTPAAVLIGRDGRIASPVSYGDEAIRELFQRVVTSSDGNVGQDRGAAPVVIGDPAPEFSLVDTQGTIVTNASLLGQNTLLLFWDPRCTHCQGMSEALSNWGRNSSKDTPRLVYVVHGTREDAIHPEQESVLFDADFDVPPLFGASSTPSAILLDADGRIASSLAKGPYRVLALAGLRKTSATMGAN